LVPSIVVGELLYGAQRSANASNNVRRVNEFCDKVTVVVCDRNTAARYGILKNQLRTAGTPIPENDLWIAAIAMQHGLPILSRDGHFDNVREVPRTGW
jgi:tRNA(fMet)-specific endonuclease VapC